MAPVPEPKGRPSHEFKNSVALRTNTYGGSRGQGYQFVLLDRKIPWLKIIRQAEQLQENRSSMEV